MNDTYEVGRHTNQIRCPYCYKLIDRQEYTRHLQMFHPEEAEEAGLGSEGDEEGGRTLRRIGNAKPPRRENVPIGMTRCEECGALVPKTRFDEHVEKKHSSDEEEVPALEICPFCTAEVREDRLEKHLRKVHGKRPDQI